MENKLTSSSSQIVYVIVTRCYMKNRLTLSTLLNLFVYMFLHKILWKIDWHGQVLQLFVQMSHKILWKIDWLILLNSQLFMYCCYLSTYDSIENKLTLSSSPIVCVIVACYSIFAIVCVIVTQCSTENGLVLSSSQIVYLIVT
jgi:hypothetical protein